MELRGTLFLVHVHYTGEVTGKSEEPSHEAEGLEEGLAEELQALVWMLFT